MQRTVEKHGRHDDAGGELCPDSAYHSARLKQNNENAAHELAAEVKRGYCVNAERASQTSIDPALISPRYS